VPVAGANLELRENMDVGSSTSWPTNSHGQLVIAEVRRMGKIQHIGENRERVGVGNTDAFVANHAALQAASLRRSNCSWATLRYRLARNSGASYLGALRLEESSTGSPTPPTYACIRKPGADRSILFLLRGRPVVSDGWVRTRVRRQRAPMQRAKSEKCAWRGREMYACN
jgi:hypothetical protein